MKKKSTYLLTFLLLTAFTPKLLAQADTIRTLVFTEIYSPGPQNYVELTNVGDEPVNLSNFKLAQSHHARVFPITVSLRETMLPDVELKPDSSFVVATVNDFQDKYGWKETPWSDLRKYGIPGTHPDILAKLDTALFSDEGVSDSQEGLDSVSNSPHLLTGLQYNNALFLEYHFGDDSVVVDQARLILDENGNIVRDDIHTVVAGVPDAWSNYVLVRKTNVTQGNMDWDDARGNSIDDSEWIPIPPRSGGLDGNNSRFYTTLGHHGNTTLDGESVSSDVIDIDLVNKTIAVPWGIYRDSIMDKFNLAGGIAWQYHQSPSVIDSTSRIVVSGDILTLYAVGEDLEQIDFAINLKDPANDMNLVFPVNLKSYELEFEDYVWSTPFYVTHDSPVIDTIGDVKFGMRVDTLFKYLEKASNASWEIERVDGTERPDLKEGDILKVTAQDGTVKNYVLDVATKPEPSHNAMLSAITWPEAPAFLRASPQWNDDTIPNFRSGIFTYELKVPYGATSVPALSVIPEDLNAQISVNRATVLAGPLEDRTTTFTVTAEDDTTVNVYSVILSEEKPVEFVQPFKADPVISDLLHMRVFNERCIEISNPGNVPLDLSDYMLVAGDGSNPAEIITDNTEDYNDRFLRYVPGYTYQPEAFWGVSPNTITKDFEVNPIIEPGGSFVLARARNWKFFTDDFAMNYDVLMTNENYAFDDGEPRMDEEATNTKAYYIASGTFNYVTYWRKDFGQLVLFKIKNDSIKAGLKPVTDPNDFEVIDLLGHWDGITWQVTGEDLMNNHRMERKPQYWRGATLPGLTGSFGATADSSEWIVTEINWGSAEDAITSGAIGHHPFDPVFDYISTVSSLFYKVSGGYKTPQYITGVAIGTTVAGFMSSVDKAHEDQTLEVMGKENDAVLAEGDTLIVTSADLSSVTKYAISVGSLSSDAVLEAKSGSGYTIDYAGSEGTISGIQFGTTIKEVLNKVIKPVNAVINVVDMNDNLVPLQIRNFNETYVDAKAGSSIYFEVIAEDGITKNLYQLILDSSDSDAYLFSDLYQVNQDLQLVSYVPQGTNVQTLFKYLHPNDGASVKLVNKAGDERTLGDVASDDEIIVTSPDGSTENVYFIQFLGSGTGTLAYVVSNVLEVDQVELLISGIPENTLYNIFLGLITPASGASVVILDSQQQPVTSGEIANGYTLKVTSGDGLKVVAYNISVLTSVDQPMFDQMRIYPNPATSRIFVEGVGINSNIVIKNISGQTVKFIEYKDVMSGSVSVEELTPGIYLIYATIRDINSRPIKLIKQ